MAEALCIAYKEYSNVSIRIARIFNTYGPFMDVNDGRVISNFCVQALNNNPLTIYGDGQQTRSFCYIDDLVSALILLMKSNIESPVNLGNPQEFTMVELAKQIIEMTESSSEYTLHKLPEDDPQRRCPDISIAREKLGWSPVTYLPEGLVPTLEWFRKCINE